MSDFYFIYIIWFVFPLAFQRCIQTVLLQKLAKIRQKENEKAKIMTQLLFKIWIWSNIFREISGSRRPIFSFFFFIRFVFPLAFQCHILNCSTAKTCEDPAKRKQKGENNDSGFSSRFGFGQTYFAKSQAVDVRFLVNFFH